MKPRVFGCRSVAAASELPPLADDQGRPVTTLLSARTASAIVLAATTGVGALLFEASAWAQLPAPRLGSVWVEDFPGDRLKQAVAAGKATVILSAGSSLAIENHVQVARYVAQRVAEELTNALVLPITASEASGAGGSKRATADAALEIRVPLDRVLLAGGFRHAVIIGDEQTRVGDTTLERIATMLDTEWRPKGVRVYYATAHEIRPGQAMTFNADYLRRWASRTIPAARRKSVEDHSELRFVDGERKWLLDDMIPVEDRAVVSAELGKILVEQRVSSILNQIRVLSPVHVR